MKKKQKNYDNVHAWLRYWFGKASKCENKKCLGISKNFAWAKKKGRRYIKAKNNFFQFCYSCHGKYDTTDYKRKLMRRINPNTQKKVCRYGHLYTKTNTRFCIKKWRS